MKTLIKNLCTGVCRNIKNAKLDDYKSVIKNIPRGTFNYKKYSNQSHGKTITSYDVIFEYVSQLPYLKVVTYPLASIIYIFCLLLYIAYNLLLEDIQYRLYYKDKKARK